MANQDGFRSKKLATTIFGALVTILIIFDPTLVWLTSAVDAVTAASQVIESSSQVDSFKRGVNESVDSL